MKRRGLDETIDAAASLAIPDLADWCLIDLVEETERSDASPPLPQDADHQAATRTHPGLPDRAGFAASWRSCRGRAASRFSW